MRRGVVFLLLATVVSAGCVQPHRRVEGLRVRNPQDLAALADDQVDLATASFVIAWDLDRRSSVGYKQVQMDALARRIDTQLQTVDDPREKMALFGRIVMRELNFSPRGTTSPRRDGKMLDWVIDHNRGDCVGLATFYLAVAERTGLPLKMATAPGHVLVVWDDGAERFYVETTASDNVHDSPDYLKERLGMHRFRQLGPMHLQPLSPRQALGVLIGQWGFGLSEQGRSDRAIEVYRSAVEINPLDSSVLFNWARELIVLERLDEAEAMLARCVKANPNFADAYSRWGMLMIDRKRYDAAVEKFDRALAIDADDPILHALRVMALTSAGRHDLARTRLDAARERFPKVTTIWDELARDLKEDDR